MKALTSFVLIAATSFVLTFSVLAAGNDSQGWQHWVRGTLTAISAHTGTDR